MNDQHTSESHIQVRINGEPVEVPRGSRVADLMAKYPSGAVAVAVDLTVVPVSAWDSTELRAGDRVEIVAAVSGG